MGGRFDKRSDELSEKELEEEAGEALPDREAMSVISSDVTIPLDPAAAASVLADDGGEADPPEPAGEETEGEQEEG